MTEHAALFTALYSIVVGSLVPYYLILKHKLEEDSAPSTTNALTFNGASFGERVKKFPPPKRM